MPRTYVDNAYNRSHGRVGLEVGSAVISRGSSGGGGSSYSGGGGSYSGGGGSYYSGGGSSGSGYSSSSSTKTYVDNAMNRSLGRVGMEHGTAVHSRSSGMGSSSSSPSTRTYVDNSMNRSLGRVGMEHGTAVHSRSSGMGSSSSSPSSRTYVDNSMNRSLGRVGLTVGSAVHSKGESRASTSTSSGSRSYVDELNRLTSSYTRSSSAAAAGGPKTYVDNAYNRRMGRVGLPYGSLTQATSTRSTASTAGTGAKTYVDNAYNRKLGRVGKPLGSCPQSKMGKSESSSYRYNEGFRDGLLEGSSYCRREPKYDFYKPLVDFDPEDMDVGKALEQVQMYKRDVPQSESYLVDKAIEAINRHDAALAYSSKKRKLTKEELDWVKGGEVIEFSELDLGEKIGGGGFGDVYSALWNGNQVAVKKLRVQRVSQDKRIKFQEEVQVYSQLSHPYIVKFFGVCVTTPNLAIVMEFMERGSLHDILHVESRNIPKKDKIQMFDDCVSALKYLHEHNITHRDLKSMNILVTNDLCHCKLGDFGLALKEDTRSSSSVTAHTVVGTLKYSPPEVVEGFMLKQEQLKKADVYSLGIVGVEMMTEKEPYDGMNQHQVRRAIQGGKLPSMDGMMDVPTKEIIAMALKANPTERPTASLLCELWRDLGRPQ